MQLCDQDHDEVCHTEDDCPMCTILEKLKGLDETRKTVEDAANDLDAFLDEAGKLLGVQKRQWNPEEVPTVHEARVLSPEEIIFRSKLIALFRKIDNQVYDELDSNLQWPEEL